MPSMRLAILLALVATTAYAEERGSLDLTKWEVSRAPHDGPADKPAAGPPRLGFAPGEKSDVVARCAFDLPAPLASRALCVSLERVRWDATVALDGQEIARGAEGDLLLDLPPLAAGTHVVTVRARDLRAASALAKRGGDDDSEGAWAAPVGPAPRLAGVLGAARIVERLPVDVRGVSVREGQLRLELRGRTGEACAVGYVFSGSARTVEVALAKGEAREVAIPWAERALWPRREGVALVVSDRVERRVALAESRIERTGGRLVVNGAPVFLALLEAPPGDAREAIARARFTGANALLTGSRRDDAWFDAVEEAGLLVVVEGDLVRPLSANALEDERLWRALEREWREVVPRLRGRAGVVAWSVARGFLREGAAVSAGARGRLTALGAVVKALDPTRPVVLAEDDGRALGFDVPWSASAGPGFVAVLPPLAAPTSLPERVALAGDPGFLDDAAVIAGLARGRARSVRQARVAGALGADLGAAPGDADLRAALGPVALLDDPAPGGGEAAERPFKRRIRADQEVAFVWTFSLGGKVVATGAGKGTVLDVEVTVPSTASSPALPRFAGEGGRLHVTASAPHGTSSLDLDVVVWPARPPLLDAKDVLLVEGPLGDTGAALLAAGVAWREAPLVAEMLERGATLVIGEGALDEKPARPALLALVERARRIGVGVLVLRQTTPYPEGLAPPLDGFEPRGARDLALRDPLERALAGIEDADLAGWPGLEGALPPPALARPLRADARVLVEGAPLGVSDVVGVVSLEDAASPEILCQVPLAPRAREVPAARALLRALVRAASAPAARAERPLFVRGDPDLVNELEALALVARPWSLEAVEAAAAPVIVVDDAKAPLGDAERAALERAVSAGATLVFRAPDDASLARLGKLAPPGLKVEKAPALPRAGPLASLHAIDLLWAPSPGAFREVASRFDAAPRSAHAEGAVALVAPGALLEHRRGRGRVLLDLVRWREAGAEVRAKRWIAQLLTELGAERREPPVRLPVTSWGGVGREGDHVTFYGNSAASARFVARRAGRYKVALELGGTKALEGYPVARVVCDARNLGEIKLDAAALKTYELEVTIPAGAHTLSVIFTNDVYDPPEDRNMMLRGAVLRLVPPRIY